MAERRRAYVAAIVCFVVAIVGGLGAAVAYATNQSDRVLGVALAVALFGIGAGLGSWSQHLGVDEHVAQPRERLRTTPEEREQFDEIVDETARTVGRRSVLGWLLGGSIGALVVGFVGPIGSLGPKPGNALSTTAWARGKRLVTDDGSPIAASGGAEDQLSTVFPDGAIGRDDSQVVLLRLPAGLLSDRTVAGGAVDGWVAYSKICPHAGCSVGLFGVDRRPPDIVRQLVCPCHQSVFDPTDAAEPVGGPAPRPLAQLPLEVDAEGYLVAKDGFAGPVGPITWLDG